MAESDNEVKWRSDGEGRLDANGVRWWACDPYPTWYRWENGTLHQRGWSKIESVPWADEALDTVE